MKSSIKTTMVDRVKYSVIFWGITIIAGVYFIPAVILAYLNPFWFRDSAMFGLQRQVRAMSKWRGLQIKPIIDKYLAFQILKNS